MRELSLFTGAGGGLLGSMLLGWRTVAAVECDPYCQRVLCTRGGYMADTERSGSLVLAGRSERETEAGTSGIANDRNCRFSIHSDIRTFHPVPGSCDVVTGGFPCQPFSQAGKRRGEDDPRNMWPHTVRVLVESGASLGFFENVPGLLSSGYFGTVLGDLAEAGFDAEWCVLGADDVGAPHRRKRLWILAYSPEHLRRAFRQVTPDRAGDRSLVPDATNDRTGRRQQLAQGGEGEGDVADRDNNSPWAIDPADVGHADESGPQGLRFDGERAGERAVGASGGEPLPDAEGVGRRKGRPESDGWRPESGEPGGAHADAGCEPPQRIAEPREECDSWFAEPYVGRVAHGVPARVDRLRALGNAQVPFTMVGAFTYLAHKAGILT